jgi:hypothetical protein
MSGRLSAGCPNLSFRGRLLWLATSNARANYSACPVEAPNTSPAYLLWTSDWDSTFQLLRLLLVHRRPVAPVYLIDENRPSLHVEMRTMDRIRHHLAALHPHTRELLRPTYLAHVSDIAEDADISAAFERVNSRCRIGTQYDWLARFCHQRGLRDIEIGFERERYGAGGLLLDLVVEDVSRGGYPVHRLPSILGDEDVATIFGVYVFPLFDVTKEQMAREVDARGWRPIMLETWFCHRPVRGRPCGRCHPCLNVITAGLGWRIPRDRRLQGTVHRWTIAPLKAIARPLWRRLRHG